jgi:hypothetical protein
LCFAGAVALDAEGPSADSQVQQPTAGTSDSTAQQANQPQDSSVGDRQQQVAGEAVQQAPTEQQSEGQTSQQQDGQQQLQPSPEQQQGEQQGHLQQEQIQQQIQQHEEPPIRLKVFLGHVPAEHAGCRWATSVVDQHGLTMQQCSH